MSETKETDITTDTKASTALIAEATAKLERIKFILPPGCLEYCFVDDSELAHLKEYVSSFDDKDFKTELSIDELKLEEYIAFMKLHFGSEGRNILTNDIIDSLRTRGLNNILDRRSIYISPDISNQSSILHREFPTSFDKYTHNLLYYYKVKNCDYMNGGTGIIFFDDCGNKSYEILPIVPGLILVLRDTCMYHHTPKLVPVDKEKPIIRTLIRRYLGVTREEEKEELLLLAEHCTISGKEPQVYLTDIERAELDAYEMSKFGKIVSSSQKYKNKYIKYKNKYIKLKMELLS